MGASRETIYWAIVLVKDGDAAGSIGFSDAGDFYTPEQNVLAFGVATLGGSGQNYADNCANFSGTTKTMRKLMGGDEIHLIMRSPAIALELDGVVQFFCKS